MSSKHDFEDDDHEEEEEEEEEEDDQLQHHHLQHHHHHYQHQGVVDDSGLPEDDEAGDLDPHLASSALAMQMPPVKTERRGRKRKNPDAPPGEKKPRAKKVRKPRDPSEKRAEGTGGLAAPMILSDALAQLLNHTELSRTQVVKQLWIYIKDKGLQDANNKKIINCDEAMKKVFHVNQMDMFEMSKLLSPHLSKKIV